MTKAIIIETPGACPYREYRLGELKRVCRLTFKDCSNNTEFPEHCRLNDVELK